MPPQDNIDVTDVEYRDPLSDVEILDSLRANKPEHFKDDNLLHIDGIFFFVAPKGPELDKQVDVMLGKFVRSAKNDKCFEDSFKMMVIGTPIKSKDDAPRVLPITPITPKFVVKNGDGERFFGFERPASKRDVVAWIDGKWVPWKWKNLAVKCNMFVLDENGDGGPRFLSLVPTAPPLKPWKDTDAMVKNAKKIIMMTPDDYQLMNLDHQFNIGRGNVGAEKWRYELSDGSVVKAVDGRPVNLSENEWLPVKTW